MHVVEGTGGQWYGPRTGDAERRHDDAYLAALADRLRAEVVGRGVRDVRAVLGFGSVPRELLRLAKQEQIDLMVMGGHGHGRLADWILGQTIPEVRHGVGVPIFTVRSGAKK